MYATCIVYVFVYVCTQVGGLNENGRDAVAIDESVPIPHVLEKDDKDAAAAIDQSVPVSSALPESDIASNVVAKESPSKRQELEIHADDIVPEVSSMIGSADIASTGTAVSKPKTYRAMYYKSGLCLKSCAYMCK